MPLVFPKSAMSLEELTICEDFLDGYREYAIDLSSNLESIAQWHTSGPEPCPTSHNGRTCTLCALCSADGLMGATKSALETYDDTEARLKTARASLGKSISSRAAPGRETLFRSGLAKALFVTIVTAGDVLRSEHTRWKTRLRDELAIATSSSSSSRPAELDKQIVDLLLPTYTGPKVVSPETNLKFSAVSTSSVAETPSESSMFVVFRRCLSADCPCELNKENVAVNTASGSIGGSQVTSKVHLSSTDAKKTHTSKRNAMVKKTGDIPDAPAKAKTHAQSKKSSMYHNLDGPDARTPATPKLPDTTLLAQETDSPSPSPECGSLIVDPRVFRLREQIGRSDDARQALIAWCRAWTANFDGTGPETPLTCAPTAKDPHKSPLAVACGLGTVDPGMSPCTMDRIGAATKELSRGDDATTVQELRFHKQEELRSRWLTARQKRCKDKKSRPAGRNLQ